MGKRDGNVRRFSGTCEHLRSSCAGCNDKNVAAALWKMAEDYQSEAVKLDSGKSPDIGAARPFLTAYYWHWLNNPVPNSRQVGAFIGALLLRGFGMATVLIVEDQEQILILPKSFLRNRATRRFQQPPLTRLSPFSLDRKPLTPFSLTSF